MSLSISETGFFSWFRGVIMEGCSCICSLYRPGRDICGVGPRCDGAVELGVTMPDIGVEARDDALPFVSPFDVPLAAFPTAAGFLDHGVGAAAAGCVLGPPSAGKASSD